MKKKESGDKKNKAASDGCNKTVRKNNCISFIVGYKMLLMVCRRRAATANRTNEDMATVVHLKVH